MNFFQSIADLNLVGDLRLNITKTAGGRMAVSLMLVHRKVADEAQKQMKPLLFSGTPQELDECLIDKMSEPMTSTSDFYHNSETYLKTLDSAKTSVAKQASANKPAPLPKTEAEKKQEQYQTSMKKADELEKEGKYREAWMKVPDIGEFPDKETEIRERRQALSAQFEPNLFS